MDLVNTLNYCVELVGGDGIPAAIGGLIHTIVIIIQIVVPILLIIWGMLDFAKSVIGGDEDKIRAGRKVFIQRIIAAIIVFLVVTVVQLVITAVAGIDADEYNESAWTCAKSLIQGKPSN